MKEIKRLSNLTQDKQLLKEMVQIDTWVSWLKLLTIYPIFPLASYQDWGMLCERGESQLTPLRISQMIAELRHQQHEGGVMGRFADCFFICSYSSRRNLQRSVRLWRKEVWNGTAEGPLTKGRTHHPRHLLLRVAPACLSVRLTSLTISGSQGHPVAGPSKSSLLSCVL